MRLQVMQFVMRQAPKDGVPNDAIGHVAPGNLSPLERNSCYLVTPSQAARSRRRATTNLLLLQGEFPRRFAAGVNESIFGVPAIEHLQPLQRLPCSTAYVGDVRHRGE